MIIVILSSLKIYPVIPVKAQGILIDPPISDPIPKGEHLDATKDDSPPELPPGVLDLSQGFKQCPYI